MDTDGEAIDGLIPKLQELFGSVGINIEDQNGELRSTFDILQDLAAVWDQLSSKQKQYFGEKVAGNRQVKTLNAIMQNWDVVADTIDKANNAQGEALKGNEMYMDSIEGRMTQLQSAFQELARTTIDSGFVKGIVSLGTNAIKLVNDLGGLPPILTTILGVVLAIKGADIVGGIAKIGSALAGLFSSFSLAAGLPGILIAVAGAIALVVNHINNANNSLAQFEKAKESYEEHKTKVESLNGELKTTEDRIAELEGKESLTIIEQEELNRLKDVNQELRDQIELEKTLQNIALSSERKSAADYLETKMVSPAGAYNDTATKYLSLDYLKANTSGVDHTQMRNSGIITDAKQLMPNFEEKINADMAALDAMLKRYREVQKEIRETREQGGDTSLLTQERKQLDEDITVINKELEGYYKTINDKTKDFDVVEDAIAGSAEDRINQIIAYRKKIEDALVTADTRSRATTVEGIKKEIDETLEKYPEEVAKIQEEIKEQGDNWQIGIPDSVKQKAKQDQDDLIAQAENFINTLDGLNDGDVHDSLGKILEEKFNTGNVDVLNRKIKHDSDLAAAGWIDAYEGMEQTIATYFSSSDFELKDLDQNIQYAITATPIDADGNVLTESELKDYIWGLIDDSSSIEELMSKDSVANGGKGLILHYTPAIDMSPEALDAAFAQEVGWAQLLHTLDAAFEQALLAEKTDGSDTSRSVAEYLKGLVSAAIDDPSFTGQALTEIYTIAKTLADGGNDAVTNALSQVDIPESIKQGIGISNMTVDDMGASHFDDLVEELMRRFGFSIEQVRQLLQEKYGNEGMQIDIGPQMNINMEDVIGKLYQTTDGYTKVLSKALSEQEKAGSLTAETLEKVMGESGLEGVAECLEKTANGYRLNTERVNEYISAQNEDIRLNAIAGIMERQIAIDNLTASMQYLTDAEWEAAENQVADWENEIIQLQAVADQAIVAADALDALREASKTADEDADHTEAQGSLKKTQEAIDAGKLGTNDFRAGLDYLLGEGWYERFNGDLDKAIAAFESKKKKFFADDDADSANNFMDALVGKGLASRDKASGEFKLLTDDITEVANALGISETAAQDLFDLLNSYSFDNKFVFGDDALDSADKIAVAQKKLEEIDEQRTQKMKELEEAQKELNKATDEETRKQKAAEIKELNGQLDELNKQYDDLSTAIDTANKAMGEGMEPPKTLEDALKQIQDYQQAITTLETNGIKPTVELQGDKDTLVKLLSDPTTTLTVNASSGEIDSKIEDLEVFKKSVDENPNIEPSVKATITGLTETAIEGLEKFRENVKELEGTNINPVVTAGTSGVRQATLIIQDLEASAKNLDKSDPVVDIKAEADKDSINEAKEALKLPSPEELTATYMADDDDKSVKTVSDLLDNLARDREVTYKPKTNAELWAEWEPGTPRMTEKDWDQWNKEADEAWGHVLNNQGMITFTPEINETAFGRDFREALQGAAENADPVEIVPEMTEENWEQWYKEFDEAWDHPLDIETNVDEDKIANQVQDGVEQGADNAEPNIDVNADEIQENITNAVEGMPDVNAPVNVDSESLVDKIKNLVKNTKLNDLIVNVKQKVNKTNTSTPKDVTQTVNLKGKDAGATKTVQNVGKEAQKGATIPIDADPKEANKEVKSLADRIKEKVFKPIGITFGDAFRQLVDAERRLAQTVYKRVEVTYVEKNKPPQAAKGTRNAKGGLTLVDEKGAELIEHPKQGTYELGTNSGARLTNLDKGDIVHTADETKKILTRMGNIGGLIKGGFSAVKTFVGDAFASGTIGQTGPMVIKPKKKKDENKTKKTKTGSSSSKSGSNSGSSSSSSSSSSSDDAMSRWTNWAKQFFDWAEIKLARLKEQTKSYTEDAARAVGYTMKNLRLDWAFDNIESEIKANEEAYQEYMDTVNDITAHATKLNNDIIAKIWGGTIDVTKYDDVTQQQIKDYQTWYEKAQACLNTIEQLKDQQKELAKQRLQNIVDDYSAYAKILETEEGIGAAQRDYNETIGRATSGSGIADRYLGVSPQDRGGQYGSFTAEIESSRAKQGRLEEERKELQQEFDNLVREGQIELGDNVWLEYTNKLKELDKDILQTAASVERLIDQANDAAFTPLWNQIDEYMYEASRKNQQMELGNLRGSLSRSGKKNVYKDLISNASRQNDNLEKQNVLYRELQQDLDKNSTKYQDLEKKIRDNESAILGNKQAIEQYQQAINQLTFDKLESQLDGLTNNADKLNDSINTKILKGIEITSSSYTSLIKNGNAQIDNLNAQKNAYQSLMDELIATYGNAAKTSDLYLQYKAQVDSLDASIRELNMSIIQWNKDMQNLAVEKVGWQLDSLKNKSNELNDTLSLKRAEGRTETASDYQKLINNVRAQNDKLNEQIDLYIKQQAGMSKYSQAYQELQNKINSNNKAIRNNLISIEQWDDAMKNLPIEKMSHKIDKLKVKEEEYNDIIKQRELDGKRITATYYRSMINNANNEISILNSQKKAYQALMNELVELYGSAALESDVYKDYENSLNNVDKEIRSLTSSTREWQIAIEELPIEELGWKLDTLNEAFEKINNLKSLNEAQGVDLTSKTYSDMIKNGMDRIKVLEEENKLLKERQKNMNVNSKAYQELQKQIAANNNEIAGIKVSQEEWNDSIVDLGIKNIQEYKDSISKSNDQLQRQKELQEAIQDLEKASSQRKVRTYIEGQGFVYQRDEDEFRKAQENLEDVIKNQLMDKLDDLIEALEDAKKDTNVYDKNGNLIGSTYQSPQLGTLASVLASYSDKNNNAALNIDVLKDAFGNKFASSVSSQNNQATFTIGDINISEVKDGNELAQAIINQFPNALLQALYSKQ